jgi:hypothetical protein
MSWFDVKQRVIEWYEVSFTWIKRMSAPASARAIATAWPMPLVPPVMRAVCPSREKRALVAGDMVICCTPELGSHTVQSSECIFVHDGFLYGEVAKALSLSQVGRHLYGYPFLSLSRQSQLDVSV